MYKLLKNPIIAPAFSPLMRFEIPAQRVKIKETKKPNVIHPKKIYSIFMSGDSGKMSLNNIP